MANIFKDFGLFQYLVGETIERPTTLTITRVVADEVRNHKGVAEKKPVVYFKETELGLILNRTNARKLADLYGSDYLKWPGRRITLEVEEKKSFGEVKKLIYLTAPPPTKHKPDQPGSGEPEPQTQTSSETLKKTVDEINNDLFQ